MTDLTFKRLSVESLHDFLNYFGHEAFSEMGQFGALVRQHLV
jgi:hypothetical protein